MSDESAKLEEQEGELSPHALVPGQLVTARLVLLDQEDLHPALLPPLEDHAHFQGVTGIIDQVPVWDESIRNYTGWLTIRNAEDSVIFCKAPGEQLYNFGPSPGAMQDSWSGVRLVLTPAAEPPA